MGQKVNPVGFRLGVIKTWDSRWFSKKSYAEFLHQDIQIRRCVYEKLESAGVSKVLIDRPTKQAIISIHASRPGMIVGKKGQEMTDLKNLLSRIVKGEVSINIVEVRKPETDAYLVADSIAQQLQKRVSMKRAVKRALQTTIRFGAQGVRICCSGRLDGAEIARTEWFKEGRIPLHTLRADVDYARSTAMTTYGTCGVKVWIYKGEVLDRKAALSGANLRDKPQGSGLGIKQ